MCRTWSYGDCLDRPNPNGHYIDGPILDMKYKSGVGWLPIPVVHGMTLGELARMVNGERWLSDGRICDLTVIPCKIIHIELCMNFPFLLLLICRI